jgi:TalC/MipB family fructose-6-phosphate aldolase
VKFIIDSGNVPRIQRVLEWLPADGISINPSLTAREGKAFFSLVQELLEISSGEVYAQVIAEDVGGIVREAHEIHKLNPEWIIVKIPATEAGFAAMKILQPTNMRICATAAFNLTQAVTAAKLGAYAIAPYVSRVDRAGGSGIGLVRQIKTMLTTYGFPTLVIAASVKSAGQLAELIELGSDGVSAAPELYPEAIQHHLTDKAVELFRADWQRTYQEMSIHSDLAPVDD